MNSRTCAEDPSDEGTLLVIYNYDKLLYIAAVVYLNCWFIFKHRLLAVQIPSAATTVSLQATGSGVGLVQV